MMRCPRYFAAPLPALLMVTTGMLCGLASGAGGQEEGGLSVRLGYSEQLKLKNDTENLRSDLSFDLKSQTRTQRFSLSLGAGLDKGFPDFSDASVQDPRASLSYRLENRAAALDLSLSYRRDEISTLTVSDDLADGALVLDEGDREDINARLGFEFGRSAPFGGTASLSYSATNYLNTADPTLIDSERRSASVNFRFTIDPSMTARAGIRVSDLDRDGGLDTRREVLSTGLDVDVTSSLNLSLDLGVTRIIRSGSVPRSVETGPFFELTLAQDMPNGNLRGTLKSDLDENGRRSSLRLTRALELQDRSLSFGIGVSKRENSNKFTPLYSLDYTQDLPRGRITAGFEQVFSSNAAGNETLNSRLRLSVNHELSDASSLNGSFNLRDTRITNSNTDTRQFDLRLDYTHQITEDWSVFSGYRHILKQQDGRGDDHDDEFFVGFRTSLGWRP